MAPTPQPQLSGNRLLTTLAAWLCLGIATLACFFPLAFHPRDLLVGPQRGGANDLTLVFLASRSFLADESAGIGQPPGWNPYALAGVPFLGNPQAASFYPPNWIFRAFEPLRAASWFLVLHHFWAGIGTYHLCRRIRCSWFGSLLAGIIFLAAPYLVAHSGEGHLPQISVAAWLPWGFLAYLRFQNGLPGGIAAVATVLSLAFFAGHAQELYYLVVILTIFVAIDAWQLVRGKLYRETARYLGNWILAGTTVVGLVLIDLAPIVLYTTKAIRSSGLSAEQGGVGIQLANLTQLLNPWGLGYPVDHSTVPFFAEMITHFGLLPLLLAVIGTAQFRRHYLVRRFAWLWILGMLFAFGSGSPVFEAAYRVIPGLTFFRAPSRILFLCSLAVAVLAAYGVDALTVSLELTDQQRQRRLRWLIAAIAVTIGIGVAASALRPSDTAGSHLTGLDNQPAPTAANPIPQIPLSVASRALLRPDSWFLLCYSLTLITACLWKPTHRSWWQIGIVVMCGVEFCAFSKTVLRTIPPESVRTDSPLVTFLRDHAENDRIAAPQILVSDREAWTHDIQKLEAYEPVPLLGTVNVWLALTGLPEVGQQLMGFEQVNLRRMHKPFADLLGLRYAITTEELPKIPPGWEFRESGEIPPEFTLRGQRAETTGYAIYENTTPLPRAFVVGQVSLIEPDLDVVTRLRSFKPTEEVILQQDLLPAGPRCQFAAATITKYSTDSVTVEATLDQPGYLVLSDTWYSGWTAKDNEQPVPCVPGNLVFRAVPLSAGQHVVEFRYESLAHQSMLIILSSTIAILLAATAMSFARRTSVRPSDGPPPAETATPRPADSV